MRLDQFLQKTGIVKQRSSAKDMCDRGAVEVNGHTAKAAREVAAGDHIAVRFRDRRCVYSVLQVPSGNVSKAARSTFVQLLAEEQFHTNE